MRYLRFYDGDDGESQCEEVEVQMDLVQYAPPAPAIGVSAPVEAARYVMMKIPEDWAPGLHASPRRQLFVLLSGGMECETSNGTAITLSPGDMLLMENTRTKGHTARVSGETTALMVQLE